VIGTGYHKVGSSNTREPMHHHIMLTLSSLPSMTCSQSYPCPPAEVYACMTIILNRKSHTPIGPEVPHTANSELSVPPLSTPLWLIYLYIPYTIYTQCQLDLHYYVHLTPGKLSPSGAFLHLDQKGLDIRNHTRRMILPIPTNVRLFTISFEVLLTESLYPTNYTSYLP